MKTSQILQELGGDGPFQVALITSTCLLRMSGFWFMFFFSFANYEPPWTCIDLKKNYSFASISRWNSSQYMSSVDPGACEIYEACQRIEFEAGSSTIVTEWMLLCDRSWVLPMMITSQAIGLFIGSVIGGQLAESFGRKLTMYGSCGLWALGAFVSVFSPNYQTFMALQCIIATCLGIMFATNTTYAMEFAGPNIMAILTILPVMGIAVSLLSVMAFFDRDWKSLTIIMSAATALMCLPVFWLPESIRWLYVRGELKKCRRVAEQVSRWNGQKECPDIDFDVLRVDTQQKSNYLDIFKNRRQGLIALGVSAVRSLQMTVYLMLGLGVKAFAGDFYVNLLLFSLLEVPIVFIVTPVVKLMGNRQSLITLSALSVVALTSSVVVHYVISSQQSGYIVAYLALAAKLCLSGTKQILAVYTGEVFPTVVRAVGYGFCSAVGSLGSIVSPYLIPTTPGSLPVCFSVAAALMLFVCLDLYLLPDTKHKPVEDFITANGYQELRDHSPDRRTALSLNSQGTETDALRNVTSEEG